MKISDNEIVIHAVGNVSPRRTEYGEPVESPFDMVHRKIKEADVSLCQLEMMFSTGGDAFQRREGTPDSAIDPANVESLVFGGFSVMSHASNNCLDYGPAALLDSIDAVRSKGIRVIGAGKDIAEARSPAVVERKGIKAGFLAYSSVVPAGYEARDGRPGCAPVRVLARSAARGDGTGVPSEATGIPDEDDVRAMEADIRKLRNQVDVVAVSMHWGQSSVPGITADQRVIGHRAIDAGADLVVGHHGGTVKGIEVYKGRAIFYCLGNFALDRARTYKPAVEGVGAGDVPRASHKSQTEPGWERNPGHRDRRNTMMVKCVAGKNGVRKVSFLPGRTNQKAEPEFVSRNDERFQEVLRYIGPQCRDLGTNLTVEGDEVVVCDSTGE
ncbi:MAG: CapA family protein [Chloroflexi bacterium]|nr:CapA family protein [Chloroflexota bacterium]